MMTRSKGLPASLRPAAQAFFSLCLAAALAACGGGQNAEGPATLNGAVDQAAVEAETHPAAPAATPSGAERGAALNAATLAAAEQQALAAEKATGAVTPAASLDMAQPGEIVAKSAYQSGAVARKAAAQRVTAYRFFNGQTAAHFFTTSETERDNVKNTQSPPFSFEGPAFSVASDFSPGLSPVHRFYNTQTGVHFYTISETERANVAATMPHFFYEGVAYHASQVEGQGFVPFYRFYLPGKGFHFYTANETEKNSIVANLSATYTFEGVGYYVLDSAWRAEKLPHTGVTDQQCLQKFPDNSVAFGDCADPVGVIGNQQDGHRATINPMSYSVVGNNPVTSCVKDNVTGLIWEGKTSGVHVRSGQNTYTNWGDGGAGDATAYVTTVNALNLCGFNDWRLPTSYELLNLGHYGKTTSPSIDTTWFPNTLATSYWSADSLNGASSKAWFVMYSIRAGASSSWGDRQSTRAVRLVRGSLPQGARFSYTSVAYGSDGANNVVNDAWTGLQWRRCEEGRVWSGSACVGSLVKLNHFQALVHASAQTGWRLPNVKELASLVDLGVSGNAARIDPTAFPNAERTFFGTSSPSVLNSGRAWTVGFYEGLVDDLDIGLNAAAVRLVRASQ